MTPKRIGIVCPGYVNGGHGGVERVATWLNGQLNQQEGFSCEIISVATSSRDSTSQLLRRPSSWRGPTQSIHEVLGSQVHHFGARLGELEVMRYQPRPKLTRELQKYDVIQVVAGAPAFALTALGSGRPVCLQVATTVASEREHARMLGAVSWYRRLSTRVTGTLEERVLARADHTFVENAWMLGQCMRLASGRVTLAPPGVDDTFFKPDSELLAKSDYILSVGRLPEARKNFAGLIRSFARAVQEHGVAQDLVIAGGGEVPRDLIDLVGSLGLRDLVRFETSVSETRLRELYQGASVFALGSFEEGLGLVFLEALACGTPVVATRTEGAKEVFARGGVGALVDIFDSHSDDFAVELARWATAGKDPEARVRAREAVESEFSNEVAVRRFTDVYAQLVG